MSASKSGDPMSPATGRARQAAKSPFHPVRRLPIFLASAIFIIFVAAPTAKAQCSFVSVTGSGFYKWSGTDAFVLPEGGSGTLTFNFTGAGCTWEMFFEGGDVNGITLPGDGSLDPYGTSSSTSVSIPITVASDAASGFTTESRGANWQLYANGAIVGYFEINQNSSGCAAALSPSSASVAGSGGSGSFTLNVPYCWYDYNLTPSGENWFATSISTTSGVFQLNGGITFFYGPINYAVMANGTTSARSASFNVVQPTVITFTVNQAAGAPTSSSPTLIATPPSITINSPLNGPNITETINFTSSNPSTPVNLINVTDDATATWDFGLLFTGPTPSSMQLTLYPAGLSEGTYTDTFVVTSDASNSPLQIPVTFNIGPASSPTLIATPPSIVVNSPVNGPNITETINFTSSNPSTPVNLTNVTDDATASWDYGLLYIGLTPSIMQLTLYPAGLSEGTYTDTFVITSDASNNPLQIPVTFNIGPATSTGGSLGVSPSAVSFAASNGQLPPSMQVSVTSTSESPISYDVTTQYPAPGPTNWVNVSPTSGTASAGNPSTVSILVSSAVLQFSNGTYTATVNINPVNGNIRPATSSGNPTVGVTLTVMNSVVSITLSPDPVSVTVAQGSMASQPIKVTPPICASCASFQSNQNWLSVSGFNGSSFQVQADATSLSPGQANATVTVQSNGSASFPEVVLPVSVSVVAPPAVNPSSLTFSATQGQPNPQQKPSPSPLPTEPFKALM